MKLILSTLTEAQKVVVTKKAPNGSLVIVKSILIKGGANKVDRKTLVTPQGVVTELTDEDFELLKSTPFYERMEKRGHIRPVETKDAAEDTKKAGMEKQDGSAQKTEADFAEGEKPKTGKPTDDDE